MNNIQSPLPPTEAAKLIKFYLNLYPDLVDTLTEYFPKPVIRKQTTFNRTIKVKIPTDKKSELAVKLAKELSFVSWFFQGYYLMVPYHSEAEWQRLTKDITKIAKEFGVKGLSFKGIKGVIKEQKKKASKSSVNKESKIVSISKPTDSKNTELDKADLVWELAKEYGYTSNDLIAVFGSDYTNVMLGKKELTRENITKLAKLFNLPESVFYPEEKGAA
jgi:hypothetical protein